MDILTESKKIPQMYSRLTGISLLGIVGFIYLDSLIYLWVLTFLKIILENLRLPDKF